LATENKVHQIYGLMQTGQGVSGMQTMNQSLFALVQQGVLAREDALLRSPEPGEMEMMLKNGGRTRAR
jgi:twitching motility protein PilT